MKAIFQPAVITPSIIVLALLAAVVVFIGAIGKGEGIVLCHGLISQRILEK